MENDEKQFNNCLLQDSIQILKDIDITECNIQFKKCSFTLIHLNIRSINKNFEELLCYLTTLNVMFDIIILSECRSTIYEVYSIPGYDYHPVAQRLNTFDSLAIFTRSNTIQNPIINSIPCTSANLISVKMSLYSQSFEILACYRSPSSNIKQFTSELYNILDHLCDNTHTIMVGDININIIDAHRNNSSFNYVSNLLARNFTPAIEQPTRVEKNSSTCIDHIFIKSKVPLKLFKSAVLNIKITDHFPVIIGIDTPHIPVMKNKTLNYNRIDFNTLLDKFIKEKWQNVYTSSDSEEALKNFTEKVNELVNNCSFTKKVSFSSKNIPIKPWITKGIVLSIRYKEKLFHKMKTVNHYRQSLGLPPDQGLINQFNNFRNLLNKIIKSAKNNYFAQQFHIFTHNPTKTWRLINELGDRPTKKRTPPANIEVEGEKIDNPQDVTAHFNKFFNTIGSSLAKNLSNNNTPLISPTLNNIPCKIEYLPKITKTDIIEIIDTLKNSKSCGYDNISIEVIKFSKLFIAGPLAHIFNLCMDNGNFPMQLKKSVIIPIFKKGNHLNISNYRPISLLPNLSKILEKYINNKLMQYLKSNYIISPNQYGFQSGKSCDDALLHATSLIYNYLDTSQKPLGIFLDLQKAFDVVNHKLLLKKLQEIGIGGKLLSLFENYLHNRIQITKIGNVHSEELEITCGVPQGSILGPTLFLIYINDLCKLNIDGHIISFADDTLLIFAKPTWVESFNCANFWLAKVYNWLNSNKLILNTEKTCYLSFILKNRYKPNKNLSISVNNVTLKNKDHVSYLGLTIDENFRWTKHLENLANKLRKMYHVFYKLRSILTITLLKKVYHALFQSLLQYGIIGWGGALNTHLIPIEIIQKQIIKIILKLPLSSSSQDAFTNLNILNVRLLFLYKLFRIKKDFNMNTHTQYDLRRKNISILKNKTIGQRQAEYFFNKIERILPSTPHTPISKHKLKVFLLENKSSLLSVF